MSISIKVNNTLTSSIDIELHGHIVILHGNSGIGKTYLLNILDELQKSKLSSANGINYRSDELLLVESTEQYDKFVEAIQNKTIDNGIKTVIIDECDYRGLYSNNDLKKCIEDDLSRHYLLIMRSFNTSVKYGDCLGTTPANIAELTYNNHVFSLSYSYDIGGR